MREVGGDMVRCKACGSGRLIIRAKHFGYRYIWCSDCETKRELDIAVEVSVKDFGEEVDVGGKEGCQKRVK
jgi:hypothetical protein